MESRNMLPDPSGMGPRPLKPHTHPNKGARRPKTTWAPTPNIANTEYSSFKPQRFYKTWGSLVHM